jgi:predicted glycoside hydrolase/deacetylase ChbG (UPF0249 family)
MNSTILVVNADDFGFSADMNAAIEEGHRAGRITHTTLMVDGAEVEGALAISRRNPGLGVGLHLDLCPAVGFYSLPYEEMRKNLSSPGMLERVAGEVRRQIARFQSFGLEFTHMDGHRHFHALPEVFETVVETAAAHGLKTLRLSKDWLLPRTPSVYWDEDFLGRARALLDARGIAYPDHFVFGWHGYSAASFQPGVNELMVHVGYQDEFYFREHQWLSSGELWRDIRESGIQVRSYRDLIGCPPPGLP